ncbi:hypothetical protein POM88_003764 [Heracleum sosnowskyi]|uniref:PGG domain-containing protein n=1 Tax=Heracleum sosnowskyi TaxID=360622 RepID=A0AAD8JIL3_9APIA|nr:hypothetical protein POM88_003764 [Heracleum sosnowskyi]
MGEKANQLALEVQTSNRPRSRCNRRAKLPRKVTKRIIFKKNGENKGNLLLVTATIIAVMAYQAAISPPAGVTGLDAKEIFFFVSGVSVKRKFFVWLLRAAMWITIMSMTQAYLLAVSTFSPGTNEYYGTVVAILIVAVTWGKMILVSFLLITYCSIVAVLWKAESRKNYSKYPSKIPPRLIVNLEFKK